MKPPILTDAQVNEHIAQQKANGDDWYKAHRRAQRDKDYEHEQQTVREIFEEIEKDFKGYIWNPLFTVKWQSFKDRFLK